MKLVQFYRDEVPNSAGYYLKDIMTWKDGALEMDHDWVQFVFPTNEPSMFNNDAPVLTKEESEIFHKDPYLQEKVKESFVRFLSFLQLDGLDEDGKFVIREKNKDKPLWWLQSFNHTMLRVTRSLKSLRLTGLTPLANEFYTFLLPYRNKVSPNTWGYWHNAVFEPLWK